MRRTNKETGNVNKVLVDTPELQKALCSGRATAVQIGTEANAKVSVGRRVFWNVRKVQQYIDSISE